LQKKAGSKETPEQILGAVLMRLLPVTGNDAAASAANPGTGLAAPELADMVIANALSGQPLVPLLTATVQRPVDVSDQLA
jgi:hypothetical protein